MRRLSRFLKESGKPIDEIMMKRPENMTEGEARGNWRPGAGGFTAKTDFSV